MTLKGLIFMERGSVKHSAKNAADPEQQDWLVGRSSIKIQEKELKIIS